MEIKSANDKAVDKLRLVSQRSISPRETIKLQVELCRGFFFCSTCKATGFILAPDDENDTEKNFIEECPDCNS
ncbi:MAG TPA: hypothetical protein VH796_07000 [Nitrososphaeraceae archaeon]|jgi:hypothetical protein